MIRFVYKTTNLVNGKIYIGQHTTENIDDGYMGSGVYLRMAFGKRGKENFKCEILKMVDGSKEDLNNAEEYYIKQYKDKVGWGMMYNATEFAGGGWNKGISHPVSEETKKKISEANKGHHHSEETKKNMSEARKGIKLSEETKKKMSEAFKGRPGWNKGIKHTDEARKKMSEALKGHTISEETKKKISEAHKNHPSFSKKVLCIETNIVYPSIGEASRQTGITYQNISGVCREKQKTTGGYHWKYIEE